MKEAVQHRSHYISRFLTRPWENEKRQLTYLDLQWNTVSNRGSKTLFRVDANDGFDSQMEDIFGANVEAPVGELRKRWLDDGRRPEVKEWPTRRALLLLLHLQAAKYAELKLRRSSGLDLMREGASAIDTLAARLHDQHHIITTAVPPHLGLLVPETGFFTFFVPDRGCATGHTLAVGMALHPQIVVAMVSKSVAEEDIERYTRNHRNMATLSAGTATRIQRVLLPPEVEYRDAEVLAEQVRSMIERNRKLLRDTQKMRGLAVQMWEHAGLATRERRVGE